MENTRVLVLGGTSEARALAEALHDEGVPFVSSLAGRVSRPRLPVGEVRIGGFGGVDGLRSVLTDERITHVVDATHPFAVGMRSHAVDATASVGVPILRLARAGWSQHPDAARWHWVSDYEEADAAAARLGTRPFITSGRQTLPHFRRLRELPCLVRVVEPLDSAVTPEPWTVMLDRGPFTADDEIRLLREHDVDVLVTKDSGGTFTAAKLEASRELGVPVVVVSRPAAPAGLPECGTVADVMDWLSAEPHRASSDA